MTRLRTLKPEGTEAFRRYIIDRRSGVSPPLTIDELLSETFSEQFEPPVEVDGEGRFENKLQMAKHLRMAFDRAGVPWRSTLDADGVWNWLSVLWFDRLTEDGIRALPHYILDEGRYRYRHLIRSAFFTYCFHGETGLLHMPPGAWGELWDQIAGRGYLFKSREVMSLIHRLCWDEENRPKKGAATMVREEIWRLLNQFLRTYDVGGMSQSEILRLIPQLAALDRGRKGRI